MTKAKYESENRKKERLRKKSEH